MVHGVVTLCFVVPFKEGEVDHPQAGEVLRVAQSEARTHFEAKFAQLLAGAHCFAGQNQHQVARLGIAAFEPAFQLFLGVELAYGALHRAVSFILDPHHSLGAYLRTLYEVGQFVELLACIACASGRHDGTYIRRVVKHGESLALGEVLQLHECHAEAGVGLVGAIQAHGIGPGHAGEGFGEVDILHIFEYMFHKAFEHLEHILLFYE